MAVRFKYIQSLVLVLFISAWGLQSLSPVVMQHFSHHDEVMMCDVSGDCDGNKCSMENTGECSCNHTSSDKDEDNQLRLCGCNHHGNEAVGTAAPFQIKTPLLSAFDVITFPKKFMPPHLNPDLYFIFKDDVFHPPRLNAMIS